MAYNKDMYSCTRVQLELVGSVGGRPADGIAPARKLVKERRKLGRLHLTNMNF